MSSEYNIEDLTRGNGVIHPVDLHVGERVRTLRKLKKLTQQDLTKMLGITFQQLQKYETGKNRVSPSMMYHLAECLGVEIMAFYEGLEGLSHDENQYGMSNEELLFFVNYRKMKPESQKIIYDLVMDYEKQPKPHKKD